MRFEIAQPESRGTRKGRHVAASGAATGGGVARCQRGRTRKKANRVMHRCDGCDDVLSAAPGWTRCARVCVLARIHTGYTYARRRARSGKPPAGWRDVEVKNELIDWEGGKFPWHSPDKPSHRDRSGRSGFDRELIAPLFQHTNVELLGRSA